MSLSKPIRFEWLRRRLKRWGAHPDSHKLPAADTTITAVPIPALLTIPLAQHIGNPAKPIVKTGDRVLRGQLIAEAQGLISAPLHAPTSGTVLGIFDAAIPHPSGIAAPAIHIEADGLDRTLHTIPVDPFKLSPELIAQRVSSAGIVGLGGATFPAAVKLSLGQRQPIPTLILNGGECEPYLSCDDRLMRERPEQVVDGGRIILRAMGGERILIGIEDNKPEAIAAMKAAASAFPEVSVVALPSRYPMGSEKQLVAWLTGCEIPSSGRAADIGVSVQNVATAAAVHRALRFGEPLISRIVTVAGGAIRAPRNLEVRIGTPISAVIDFCGGIVRPPERLLIGGPMMGTRVTRLDTPIIKGSGGVLALTREEIATPDAAAACIRCGACVSACPIGLVPLEMAALIRADQLPASAKIGLKDCIGCGTCAYVCPSRIPLAHYFNHAKAELAARDRERMKQTSYRELAQARSARVEREQREKAEAAARRKAERERAKLAARQTGEAQT